MKFLFEIIYHQNSQVFSTPPPPSPPSTHPERERERERERDGFFQDRGPWPHDKSALPALVLALGLLFCNNSLNNLQKHFEIQIIM